MICCICGNADNDVKWCNLCAHAFCGGCRWLYFHRGLAAIKEWLAGSPPKYCAHPQESE